MGRRIRRKKAKLVGRDENSLTEWQKEKTTTILIKAYTTCSVLTTRCSACSRVAKASPSARSPLKY